MTTAPMPAIFGPTKPALVEVGETRVEVTKTAAMAARTQTPTILAARSKPAHPIAAMPMATKFQIISKAM